MESILSALVNVLPVVLDPARLLYLLFGVLLGLVVGILPGVGGLTGVVIVLPFALFMEPYSAFGLMMGLAAANNTSDTISAVLLSIPGGASSQATVLDGYPLARQGQAGRALGAAFTASMLGGVIGALLLSASIYVARPMVMAIGSPELFMFALFGLTIAGFLSGREPVKGLIAAGIGLLVGMVGLDPLTGSLRWTFDSLYLFDGIPLEVVSLGVFALPEMIDLMIKGTQISDVPIQVLGGVGAGIRDAFRHWFLVVRTSVLGAWIGVIPGLGGPVVNWFAYGHALRTEKGARETFGKGDIRGVIGVDASNNAIEGGALIPTLLLGVPGTTTMALFIEMFIVHGLQPGPEMVANNLDVILFLIWSLVVANIMATGICLLLTSQFARLTLMPIHYLAPVVIVLIAFAAFQASRSLGDLTLLGVMGLLGWLMKRFRYPRPPLVLAVVLSTIVERYLFISVSRYGLEWLGRPIVVVTAVLILLSVIGSARGSFSSEAIQRSAVGAGAGGRSR